MRLLWIPHTGWHIPQRAHLFCRALAERHEVHVTDLVADFAGWRDSLSARYLRNFTYRRSSDGPITVHGVPRISPALFSPQLRRLNERLFTALLRRLIARYRFDVVVGTFVVPPPRAERLVFDLFDENSAAWQAAGCTRYAAEIDASEDAYLQHADAVVAASSVLADKARTRGARGPVAHIPNGIDLGAYGAPERPAQAKPGAGGYTVGVVGNLNSASELDRVLGAAHLLACEPITLLIVGRGTAVQGARRAAASAGLSNVRFYGYLPPEQLPELLATFDVGLCPYDTSPMDDARSPMRLLAYAAAGLPTVCTDIAEVRRMGFANVVLVEPTAAGLAEGVRQALALPRARPAQIVAYDLARLVAQYEAILSEVAAGGRLTPATAADRHRSHPPTTEGISRGRA